MRKRILALLIAVFFTLSLGACGGSSTDGTGTSGGGTESSDTAGDHTASGYIDEFGVMTARALVELDGAELTKVAEEAGYTWDEKRWSKEDSDVTPTKGLTQEESDAAGGGILDTSKYDFTAEEVEGFEAGGKGTPVCWLITGKAGTDSVEQVLAGQQVKVADQCEVENEYYGREIWAIVENSAGDRFLLCAQHYDDMSVVCLYTADYIAHNEGGISSHFHKGDYLFKDAYTIDDIWPILQSGDIS